VTFGGELMCVSELSDSKIVDSWRKNALPWTTAVRAGQIASRQLCTNQAIVDAVMSRAPRSVLDVGCGEGWLARDLGAKGVRVTGVDVVPVLVEQARSAGGADFHILSYEELAAGALQLSFDVVVCNFSLLGKESVEGLFTAFPSLLTPEGATVIQTLHPVVACGNHPYEDGWRRGSWDGFSADFTDPAPWYFRTWEGWNALFARSRLSLVEVREPRVGRSAEPASIIFIVEK